MSDPIETLWSAIDPAPPQDPYVREAGRALFCEAMAKRGIERAEQALARLELARAELDELTAGVRAWQSLGAEHARRAARAASRAA